MSIYHAEAGAAIRLLSPPRGVPVDAGAAARPSVERRGAPLWLRRRLLALVGLETLLAAVAGGVVVVSQWDELPVGGALFWAAITLVVAWPSTLGLSGAYSMRVFGTGSDEYRRVGKAGLTLLAVAGFTSYAGSLDLSRLLIVVALPALVLATIVGRVAVRRNLRRMWARGECMRRVVLVGRGAAVLDLGTRLARERFAGLQVVAACVTRDDRSRVSSAAGFPVGGMDDVLDLVERTGADTVAVTTASEAAATYLRHLSWQLEGTGIELLVAPGLVEVSGPRMHIRPFEGLPLLSVEQPRFEGWPRVVKGAVDRLAAGLGLVLLAPLLLAIAAAVAVTTPGPVLYRQQRIGVHGRPFTMLKFRSMVVDADVRRAALQEANVSDGLLFKIPDDPRVTSVGRWLRRHSLDELPQLINVLGGSMSLVGPRPPLPSEVAHYDSSISRRLLVKPGLTGLWQISGRSDLPWEEAVRLDLRYVENWSLALDALILWKTGRAVLTSSGAY